MRRAPNRPAIPQDAVVVLDVDDTLYLEEAYVRSGFTAVGRHLEDSLGLEGVGDTLWTNFVAGVRGDAFDRALDAHGYEPSGELIARLIEVYRHHKPNIEPTPDAQKFLQSLAGRAAAAITDGPAPSQRRKVEALDLERYLDTIVITAELGEGYGKPHPRAFELVEKRFDAPPDRCVYIGDNPAKDFLAPLQRGWGAIRVRRPSSLHYAVPTPAGVDEVASLEILGAGIPAGQILRASEPDQSMSTQGVK